MERLATRGVSQDEIEETLRNPDADLPSRDPRRRKYRKRVGGIAIQLIVVETEKEILVITAMKDPI